MQQARESRIVYSISSSLTCDDFQSLPHAAVFLALTASLTSYICVAFNIIWIRGVHSIRNPVSIIFFFSLRISFSEEGVCSIERWKTASWKIQSPFILPCPRSSAELRGQDRYRQRMDQSKQARQSRSTILDPFAIVEDIYMCMRVRIGRDALCVNETSVHTAPRCVWTEEH